MRFQQHWQKETVAAAVSDTSLAIHQHKSNGIKKRYCQSDFVTYQPISQGVRLVCLSTNLQLVQQGIKRWNDKAWDFQDKDRSSCREESDVGDAATPEEGLLERPLRCPGREVRGGESRREKSSPARPPRKGQGAAAAHICSCGLCKRQAVCGFLLYMCACACLNVSLWIVCMSCAYSRATGWGVFM